MAGLRRFVGDKDKYHRYKKKSLPKRPKISYIFGYDEARCSGAAVWVPQRAGTPVVSDEDVPATPLIVLLRLMREKWRAGDRDGAAVLARAAAPYTHHRLATAAARSDRLLEVHLLTDAELTRHLELLAERERASTENKDVAG